MKLLAADKIKREQKAFRAARKFTVPYTIFWLKKGLSFCLYKNKGAHG
jgi:hypothetical protein